MKCCPLSCVLICIVSDNNIGQLQRLSINSIGKYVIPNYSFVYFVVRRLSELDVLFRANCLKLLRLPAVFRIEQLYPSTFGSKASHCSGIAMRAHSKSLHMEICTL